MSNEEQGNEQGHGFDRRAGDSGGEIDNAPIRMDLPEIEKDAAGIPTFVFHDKLATGDLPSEEKKTMEVVMLWREAVMSVGHYSTATSISIGDVLKNDFRVVDDSIPAEQFELVGSEDGNFVVNWTEQMAFEVRGEDGALLSKDDLTTRGQIRRRTERNYSCSQYVVGLHDRVAIQIGEITFVLQFVSPARLLKTSIFAAFDLYFTKILSFSFLGHFFLLLALFMTPLEPEGLTDDLFKNPSRFVNVILKKPKAIKKDKKKFKRAAAKKAAPKKEAGKFGKTDAPKKDARASTKGAPKVDPNKREKDRKIALESGIFKTMQGGKGGASSSVFGPGGLGTGINNALGGLRGTASGDAGGAGGLGTRGTGPGGGGNSLGIGGLGSGTGGGGAGRANLGGRGKGKYRVSVGRATTKGCLTQQVVLRVLSRANSQARYCYEKELGRHPNLAGKIVTAFQIGSTGKVKRSRIASSTMGNKAVEKCLTRVIKRLRFPPCRGGGVADVTYPWIFKSGG